MDATDHDKILNLLKQYAVNDKARLFAHAISKKAFGSRHLYEDLGFESRSKYNECMIELYLDLARQKPSEVRWKKFLFDQISSRAPACAGCPDEDICHSCELS